MCIPTEQEINTVLDKCADGMEGSAYPGMSYEDGVKYAIDWVRGDGDNPFEDEE